MLTAFRSPLVVAIVSQIVAVVLQSWLTALDLDLVGSDLATWATWLCVTVVAAGTSLLAAQLFSRGQNSGRLLVVLIAFGAAFGFVTPIAASLRFELPDAVAGWSSGPALPTWQGVLTMILAVTALVSTKQVRNEV
jgi:hypothetical protein